MIIARMDSNRAVGVESNFVLRQLCSLFEVTDLAKRSPCQTNAKIGSLVGSFVKIR